MNLTLAYPTWYFALCLLAGIIGALVLYYRDWQFKELGNAFKKWLWILAAIRALSISFIAFLLLSPLLRSTVTRIEKPVILFAQDNSSSVMIKRNAEDSGDRIGVTAEVVVKGGGDLHPPMGNEWAGVRLGGGGRHAANARSGDGP